MAVVTGITVERGIVSVSADGLRFARIRSADFARFPLEEGDAFDPDEYMDRLAAEQLKDACNTVVALLKASDKTRAELIKTLTRKGFVIRAAEAAADRACEARYVDDRRYAARMVERSAGGDKGIYALKRKMYQKGISGEDAEEALSALDGEQQKTACKKAYDKIKYRYEDLEPRQARGKAAQALARRGFSWDTISSVIDTSDDYE